MFFLDFRFRQILNNFEDVILYDGKLYIYIRENNAKTYIMVEICIYIYAKMMQKDGKWRGTRVILHFRVYIYTQK